MGELPGAAGRESEAYSSSGEYTPSSGEEGAGPAVLKAPRTRKSMPQASGGFHEDGSFSGGFDGRDSGGEGGTEI